MEMVSQILAIATGTTAVGSLAILFTMKENGIATVRAILVLKVWGIGFLFAALVAPLAVALR